MTKVTLIVSLAVLACQMSAVHGWRFFDRQQWNPSSTAKVRRGGARNATPDVALNLDDVKTINQEQSALSTKHNLKSRKAEAQLNFGGEFEHVEDLKFSSKDDRRQALSQMGEFFESTKHRDLLFKGGDNPWEEIAVNSDLLNAWEEQSTILKSQGPDRDSDDNQILAIYSSVPLLPGLKIDAVSYTGVNLLRSPLTGLPMYEFTLIKEFYLPSGSKGMKWLFNKVAGDKNNPGDIDDQCHLKDGKLYVASPSRQTHCLARVALEEDLPSRTFRIHYFGRVLVSCQVPKRLLSLLPLSKKAVEARVSKSIVQQLQREGVTSLKKYKAAVDEWAKSML